MSLLKKALILLWASQVAQWVKNLPAKQETQETQVRSLGQEDPLGKFNLKLRIPRDCHTEEVTQTKTKII